ncbi:MAG: DoxX family protein [Bacillota bacterium]
MKLFRMLQDWYGMAVVGLECGRPPVDLALRLWVAWAFYKAGLVKIADMDSTIDLFTNTYHVPFLPPVVAAYLGTGVELVVPFFLAFGLLGRLTAAFLFVYNLIAVISFPDLWPDGFWTGLFGSAFKDHKIWGLMLLVTLVYGPGKLSLDYLLVKVFPKLKTAA